MNYREALAWLYATQRFGIKLGLENIERLLVALAVVEGRALRDRSSGSAPDNAIVASQSSALPLVSQCTVIHVAGTNGKGSVCAMIDAIVATAGYRDRSVHLPSPHHLSRTDSGERRNDFRR